MQTEGVVATDEASLLAAARAEGKVLVDGEIALTKTLRLCEKPSDFERETCHCERRAHPIHRLR